MNARNVAFALGMICTLLAVGLVGAVVSYSLTVADQSREITELTSENEQMQAKIEKMNETINSLNASNLMLKKQVNSLNASNSMLREQVNNLTSQVTSLGLQMSSLQNQMRSQLSEITELKNQAAALQNQIDALEVQRTYQVKLNSLVYHVCEKNWVHVPDANHVYQQILALNNNTYNILLFPEYMAHENWSEELGWIRDNFGGPDGIPIMLEVFGGGPASTPTPMLSSDDTLAAIAVSNVQWLRFSEVISWHMEHNVTFPAAYVTAILNFCRENNLKLFWTEWKVSSNVFQTIQAYIAGYEDIVTVSFSTNSGELEPLEGFELMNSMFQHWGGSVQAWYWETRYRGTDPLNMPSSLLIEHALSAKNMGAEIIAFEPYWYFFDNGEAKESLRVMQSLFAELA